MHSLWDMGQMTFTKYIILMDDDVDMHNTSEFASGSKLGFDVTKKLPGEGFKRPWPPLLKMDAAVKAEVEKLFGGIA